VVVGLTVALPPAARAQTVAPTPPAPLSYSILSTAAIRDLSTKPVAPVPPGYVGVSMDYCQISKYTGRVANPILAHLLMALSPTGPVIRIGGDELGTSCAGEPPSLSLDPPILSALARRTDAKLILGVDFVSQDPDLVAPEVSTLLRAINPRAPYTHIEAFEIGNEPDLYPNFGPGVAPADTRPYFEKYLTTFNQWANLIRYTAVDKTVGIAGPSLGRFGLPWITGTNTVDFKQLVDEPGHPTVITFHTYPLLGTVRCPSQMCPSIQNLLSDHSSAGLANGLAPFANALAPGEELRVDEMNSVTSGGVAGVSNTFASALWILETLFSYLRAGVSGVNVHTFPDARYALYSGPKPGGWVVYPEYYGMLAFERAAPAGSQLLTVTPGAAARVVPGIKVWATRTTGGDLTDVVINRSTTPEVVWLHGTGVPNRATARIASLEAPATNAFGGCPLDDALSGLCATTGITLDGASFGARDRDGGDHTATGVLPGPPLGTCTELLVCDPQPETSPWTRLEVPAASALFLSGPPGPTGD
jgi:hypothetical protein